MTRSLLPMIHSTFRDDHGKLLLPKGLQWSLPGTSHVRFVLPRDNLHFPASQGVPSRAPTTEFRFEILQAFNRWCFAKDLSFKTAEDIASIEPVGEQHFRVDWKKESQSVPLEKAVRFDDVARLLQEDAIRGGGDHVWIQGDYKGPLSLDTVETFIQSIPTTENRLEYRRTEGRIRIQRYYRGHLRKPQVWDHIWDNLVALEDPQIIDDTTLIGSVTLKDWVLGGYLTSRLYVQDRGDSILFLRPLHNDDITTSDRRYVLEYNDKVDPGVTEARLILVRQELDRLRYLATLEHPFDLENEHKPPQEMSSHEKRLATIREQLSPRRGGKGRFFGI